MPTNTLPSQFSFRDFSLRLATANDIETLVSIINQAYSYIEEARGAPRTNRDHLNQRISKTNFFVVVNSVGAIVGCFYTEPQATSLLFGMLALIPKQRGTGLGKAIAKAVEEYAKNTRYKTVMLDYMSVSPWLKKYYESYGFSENGQIEHWGTIDLIRMSKDI